MKNYSGGNAPELVRFLLDRGDRVYIDSGRLRLEPVSGKEIPKSWLLDHGDRILNAIVECLGIRVFTYLGCKVGKFDKGRHSGVSLQFECTTDRASAYVIFNVETTRSRNTVHGKRGSDLPAGQFRVRRGSKFFKFWLRANLEVPPRLSSFHDYMGNLKSIIFIGDLVEGERLDKDSIRPLSVSAERILGAVYGDGLPDNYQTTARQIPDKPQTKQPDKNCGIIFKKQSLRASQDAGESCYGSEVNRNKVVRPLPGKGRVISFSGSYKDPRLQTNEEWLEEYGDVE